MNSRRTFVTLAVIFGISYTGRSDFNVGVEMAFARLSQRDSNENIDSGSVRVALRYYF